MTVFKWRVRVYWEDTDAGGIVYYANYFKFFERARTEWLRAAGFDQTALRQQAGGTFVAVHASARYLRPARLDDRLTITVEPQELGRASLTLRQQAFLQLGDRQPAALLCSGEIRLGWVREPDLAPARIPSFILDSLH